ncbi:MAG: beta-ketoacyl-[acyl-carrier-protein] synthase II, partial [Gemmatimonadales bacterium]|nr:beta-ketoacyl-[acyl-carrier-protein] synthase II [Gemmatimonadales bacterium]
MGNGTGEVPRRVVVTGMGLVSPVGKDLESSWQNMLDGKSGGGPVTQCEVTDEWACRVACEVKGFDPLDHMDRRDAKRQDRVSQFGIAASGEA